jgi:hypothetical protein
LRFQNKEIEVLKRLLIFVLISVSLNSCFLFGSGGDKPKPTPVDSTTSFNVTPQVFDTPLDKTNEASGIAPSRLYFGSLFIIEDSEASAGYHVFSKDGSYQKFVNINGQNRDWEDMATGAGPEVGKSYIYAADIGDNNGGVNKQYTIYRFEEPNSSVNFVEKVDAIQYFYPNNASNNAETLLLDPKTKDLYIITKDELNVKVFRLKYPQPVNQPFEAEFLGTIPYWGIVGGDISADGNEILLKTYIAVFYWKLKANETIFQALSRNRDVGAPYLQENQGESICWDYQAKGYYTISERGGLAVAPKLYYYSKK